MRRLIAFVVVVLRFVEGSASLCSASSALKVDDSYHSFPPDIYDPSCQNFACEADKISMYKTKPCFSVELQSDRSNHTCGSGDSVVCPLLNEHIEIGLERQRTWMQSSSLCNLRDSLPTSSEPDKAVNVIVFGGSVTAGVSTQGCCDKDSCSADQYYRINEVCNWVSYLGRWLSSFGPNVKTYNLAHAGYNSDTYKDKIVEKLDLIRPNFLFKKSDVVLLDLSMNDANTFEGTPAKMLVLERGLEALVRRVHWLSEPESMPTIVILEMWLGAKKVGDEYPELAPYARTYERIARHYNITLWSYRDVVRHYYNAHTHERLMKYLSFQNNYGPSSGHPPWHVHLFYADFVAALMQNQLDSCASSSSSTGTSPHTYPVIRSTAQLPAPLAAEKFHHCDAAYVPLLSVSAPEVSERRVAAAGAGAGAGDATNPPQLVELGSSAGDTMVVPGVPVYLSTPAAAWNIVEDKAGRPGFIHEFPPDREYTAVTLNFHLNITHEEFAQRPTSDLLQLLYLRTYANAGKAHVLLCGNPLQDGRHEIVELDALWGDYKTFKFSLPEVYSIELNKDLCSSSMRKDPESKYVSLQIVHFKDVNSPPEMMSARGNQKFKLVDAKVCVLASTL
jgi:hypothetical protein